MSGERGEEQVGILGVVFDRAGGATAAWRATGTGGGMAPVSIVTGLHPEFSGLVRKIPTGPEWIRKNPDHSE